MRSVYVMGRDDGAFKVGISKAVDKRLYQLSSCSGHRMDVVCYTEPRDDACSIERWMHRQLTDFCIGGEWFLASKDLIINTLKRVLWEIRFEEIRNKRLDKIDYINSSRLVPLTRQEITKLELMGEFGPEYARLRQARIDGSYLAQWEREWNWERTMHGLKAARERGVVGGQKEKYPDEKIKAALKKAGSVRGAAKIVGCKPITIIRRQEAGRV